MSAPKQARSLASMNRMLDAAEELLDGGGPDALTVDAVVATAETSVGSFYARFGDRSGLLVALQDRFLSGLSEALDPVFRAAATEPNLSSTLDHVVSGYLDAFRIHRQAFVAFMLVNRSDLAMRERGAESTHLAARALHRALTPHRAELAHTDPVLAADVAHRTLFALATQSVMFDPDELGPQPLPDRQLDRHIAAMVYGYLTTPIEDPELDGSPAA